jgi:predicted nucleic acid-binding protein
MADVFADTSGWASWLDRSQPFHALAQAVIDERCDAGAKFITTNYVLAELVALLTRPLRAPRPVQIQLMADLRAAPWVEVVHLDRDAEDRVWQLWGGRPDKEWSWVDGASFVVMSQLGLTEALTTDHHFEQAGFIRLLK